MLPAAGNDPVQIFPGWQSWNIPIRRIHGVGHNRNLVPLGSPDRYRFLAIENRKPFITIQGLLIFRRDPPEDSVHEASLFRQNGGNAFSAAVTAERQPVIFQPHRVDDLGIRTAERHLVCIHIAAVSKIQQRAAAPTSRTMAFFLFRYFMPAMETQLVNWFLIILDFDHLLSFLVLTVLHTGVMGLVIPPCPVAGKIG